MSIKSGSWNDKNEDLDLKEFSFNESTPDNPTPVGKVEKLSSKRPTSYGSTNEDPPFVNYDKLYEELGKYNFQIEREANISDIREYFETIQKFRSRLIALEQEAERNYSSIDMSYEILFSYELLQRPEKTAKEKEAGALLKLAKWAEAVDDAKVYSNACKKFREQLDTTHHILTKILTTYDLEIRFKAYQGKLAGSFQNSGDIIEGSW
jgi:hypothetical protein